MILSCRKRGPRARIVAGTVFLVLAAAVTAAHAQAPKGRVSITGQAGGCIPSLGDVNRDIRLGNEALQRYDWRSMDQIGVGFTFTGDLRARVYGPITLSLGLGHSFAQTGIDFNQVISVKPKVNFYHFRVFYDLPFKPKPRMFFRIGAGPVIATSARVDVRHEYREVEGGTVWVESARFRAKGTGVHALIESELMLNQKTTLIIDVGYRSLSLDRSGNANDFRDWSRTEVRNPQQVGENGFINLWDLATEGQAGGYLSASFLNLFDSEGHRRAISVDGVERPRVWLRGMGKIDWSGPQASVGLRFYLF
jgi:hypothetical protein